MNSLYPLKFKPIFKDKIWGGTKIHDTFGLDTNKMPDCGEAWLVSGVEGNNSQVINGFLQGNELNELVSIYMGDLVGEKVYDKFGEEFPILIKILDANDWLSIQVHPDDELAQKRGLPMGKTEMWYTIQADKDAQLITGFGKDVTKEQYLQAVKDNKITDLLNYENVSQGDVYFIPAGRVHALGPGCLIAEIQQTSDTTYRIYDYDRIGIDGLKRELHTQEAIEAISYKVEKDYKTHYTPELNKTTSVVDSPFFTTEFIELQGKMLKEFNEIDSFILYFCTENNFTLEYDGGKEEVKAGECILVPNNIESVFIESKNCAKILEVYIK
ncbi:MAG: type I phosphomannose isomerase catalytic subunit [Bacteroidales bacterium]